MSKKLAKAVRADGWDRRLEEAVSTITSSGPTDALNQDVAAVCDVISATVGVAVTPRGKDAKAFVDGLEPVNRFNARRGDIGLVFFEGRYFLGVVSSAGFVVRMAHGASIFPLADIEQAYKIGA
ncbi:DUF6950 family protein [Agrobacterium larrymoorei]|uniref:DUF6950 family protein n=1 Tax=Agrobacterium larrymoorei TaxID=160699 RepID=UPI0030C3D11C